VEAGGAREAALDMAARFGALPPVAVRMSKQSIDMAAKALNHATTYMDRDQFALAATSKDQQEAVSAFLEKQIGRASCRERGWSSGVEGSWETE